MPRSAYASGLMKVVILNKAEEDLFDGYWFYENQDPDIGDYFVETSAKAVVRLMEAGGFPAISRWLSGAIPPDSRPPSDLPRRGGGGRNTDTLNEVFTALRAILAQNEKQSHFPVHPSARQYPSPFD